MSKLKYRQPLEKEIQKTILEWLQWNGVFCWKQNNSGIYKPETGQYIPSGKKGISDILGILNGGRFLAIEVKRKGKFASPDQMEFIKSINENKGLAFVASSVEEVQFKLKDYFL